MSDGIPCVKFTLVVNGNMECYELLRKMSHTRIYLHVTLDTNTINDAVTELCNILIALYHKVCKLTIRAERPARYASLQKLLKHCASIIQNLPMLMVLDLGCCSVTINQFLVPGFACPALRQLVVRLGSNMYIDTTQISPRLRSLTLSGYDLCPLVAARLVCELQYLCHVCVIPTTVLPNTYMALVDAIASVNRDVLLDAQFMNIPKNLAEYTTQKLPLYCFNVKND